MSSTNRSNAKERHISDYYITPIDKIQLFIDEFIKYENNIFNNSYVLDPCAGGDKNHLMSYPEVIKKYTNKLITMDIREDSPCSIHANYLDYNLQINPNIIITNPPFNVALDIINKALNDVDDDGFVIMLLRLNFFGSKSRYKFFQNNPPKYAFIHSKRLSFTDDGKTDSIEYMHCVWQKNYKPEFTLTKIIQ